MNDEILALIYAAIDSLNDTLEGGLRIEKSENATIFGSEGSLDSLALVNFIVALEQVVQERMGALVVLTDDDYLSPEKTPYRSVKSTHDYIVAKIARKP